MNPLRFHERMSGWISFDEHSYNQAAGHGKRVGNACAQSLEIGIADLDRFIDDPAHVAAAEGVVECPSLGGTLHVQPGSTFNLFAGFQGRSHKRMLYRLYLRDRDERTLTLSGFKDLENDPNLDVWGDTSRLFVRILSGHVEHDPLGHELTVATGILYISRLELMKMVASARGSARTKARFGAFFGRGLFGIYGGRATTEGSADFPAPTHLDARWQDHPPERWHDLEDHPGLSRRILALRSNDAHGTALTLHHIRGEREPTRGPVLLIHGSGVRANLFYGAPLRQTLVDALVERGYDVWLENWRASIDLPPREYTLDQGAAYDHPAAVARVRRETGADTLKAIVQCQGSTSLTMAAIAGLVPEITTIVCNAVSLHVSVPRESNLKLRAFVPLSSRLTTGLDPQWELRPPSALAANFARLAHLVRHRDCDNPTCQFANYMYGVGPDLLWRHSNLDAATHDWVAREFGFCPFTFLKQIGRAQSTGYIVPVDGLPQIPPSLVDIEPMTDARFSFLAGTENRIFLPLGQRRSFEHFDRHRRGYHTFHALPGYTHLDVMFGRNAHRDVFPLILSELERGP